VKKLAKTEKLHTQCILYLLTPILSLTNWDSDKTNLTTLNHVKKVPYCLSVRVKRNHYIHVKYVTCSAFLLFIKMLMNAKFTTHHANFW